MKLHEIQSEKENAILVTVSLQSEERKGWSVEDATHELEELVDSAGRANVIDKVSGQRRISL
jgi:hypothetical protein